MLSPFTYLYVHLNGCAIQDSRNQVGKKPISAQIVRHRIVPDCHPTEFGVVPFSEQKASGIVDIAFCSELAEHINCLLECASVIEDGRSKQKEKAHGHEGIPATKVLGIPMAS